jgi:uncharacterized membrane protein
MPKLLFYIGTAFCLFLALTSAAELLREIEAGSVAFAALQSGGISARAPWAILVALVAGLAVAAVFVRMAALLAARNLFGAFLALFSVIGAVASLAAVLLLQSRMVVLTRGGTSTQTLAEVHVAGWFVLGYFVSLSLLSLRPYFRIQASRFLSVMVIIPLPVFALMLTQELFVTASAAPLPIATPASFAFFAVFAILFFSIAVHCIRHRHLFLEMTNLRELLDGRVDPAARAARRTIGGVAFDS